MEIANGFWGGKGLEIAWAETTSKGSDSSFKPAFVTDFEFESE
jgi:hypothetical protein